MQNARYERNAHAAALEKLSDLFGNSANLYNLISRQISEMNRNPKMRNQ
jgi:hypothetical protein